MAKGPNDRTTTVSPSSSTSTPNSPGISPPNTTSTAATSIRKPDPVILHQATATSPTFASKGSVFPIPSFRRASLVDLGPGRRSSQGGTNTKSNPDKGDDDSKTSPPVANRRGSATITVTSAPAPNRLSQSWLADVSEDASSTNRDDDGSPGGVDWDLEKGVRLEELRSVRIKAARRKSLLSTTTSVSDADATAGSTSSTPHPPSAHPCDRTSLTSRPSTLHEEDELSDDDDEEPTDEDWSHYHPCYPHPNPHVPLDSPEFQTTRVIRIPRDYEINGDNTPAYSIVYPVILDPYVTEEQFRMLVDTLNEQLRAAYDPWNKWNWIDALLGLVTLWVWEELWPSYIKRRLREVDGTVVRWNERLRGQGAVVVGLRRTGYINVSLTGSGGV